MANTNITPVQDRSPVAGINLAIAENEVYPVLARFSVVALLLVAAGTGLWLTPSAAGPAPEATFEAGENAYVALNFDEARADYLAATKSAVQSLKDRAASWRQLGNMAWRLREHVAEAENDFREALALVATSSETQAEIARFKASIGRFDDSLVAANSAAVNAATEGPSASGNARCRWTAQSTSASSPHVGCWPALHGSRDHHPSG